MKKLVCVIGLLLLGGCVSPGDRLVRVIESSLDKTVIVRVIVEKDGEFGQITGSGVFINDKGLVLTCAHLFTTYEPKSIVIERANGDSVAGELVFTSASRDLALIKTTYYSKTPYAKVARPGSLKVGQEVFAIGNPLNVGMSATFGIISQLYCDFSQTAYNVTQSDTAINPGNSGGPLFNLKGELVGINSFMIPPVPLPVFTGIGYSVQPSEIVIFLTQYKKSLRMSKIEVYSRT